MVTPACATMRGSQRTFFFFKFSSVGCRFRFSIDEIVQKVSRSVSFRTLLNLCPFAKIGMNGACAYVGVWCMYVYCVCLFRCAYANVPNSHFECSTKIAFQIFYKIKGVFHPPLDILFSPSNIECAAYIYIFYGRSVNRVEKNVRATRERSRSA